ncbi:MAG: DEAD/DEAH box helicase family protein, partial [Chloroflexi bacterium]|nr:DEAD/DEAH box helicase family protein [Chloroflexota bacterium]
MLQTFVAIDLETTGLQPAEDEIIEVAAVKFRGPEVLDTFHTLVDPGRPLPLFIQALTGITPTDLHGAPRFSSIASDIGSFIRGYPIVGQRVAFDLGFLAAKGIAPSGPVYDAYDLATALLPGISSYRLGGLGKALDIPFSTLHRALADAVLTKEVFLALLGRLFRLDPGVLMEMGRVAALARLPLHPLLQTVIEERIPALYQSPGEKEIALPTPRPPSPSSLTARAQRERLDPEAILGLLGPEGPFAAAIPGYEQRPGQLRMLAAVAEALNDGGQLLVEAGTGTGKSLAYLLPASLHAVRNRVPVVVSTNTINLQEQLVGKDIPSLLEAIGDSWLTGIRVAQLKGRSNYLCLRRWQRLRESTELSPDEARLVLRLLVWLPQTETGDRAELNFTQGEGRAWERISAQADNCLTSQCRFLADGSCYLYSARRRAETSHIVVTNHALLLADAAGPGRVLPDADYLIIDEAHHLEEEATRHFGYQVTAGDLWRLLDDIAGIAGQTLGRGSLSQALGSRAMAPALRRDIEKLAGAVARRAADARKSASSLFGALAAIGADEDPGGKYLRQMRITRGTRNQAEWADIELAWENLGLVLSDVEGETLRLQSALGDMSPEASGVGNVIAELTSLLYSLAELRRRLTAILLNPEAN